MNYLFNKETNQKVIDGIKPISVEHMRVINNMNIIISVLQDKPFNVAINNFKMSEEVSK